MHITSFGIKHHISWTHPCAVVTYIHSRIMYQVGQAMQCTVDYLKMYILSAKLDYVGSHMFKIL